MFCKNSSLIFPNAQPVLVVTAVQFSQPVSVLPDAIFTLVQFQWRQWSGSRFIPAVWQTPNV